MKTLLFGYGSLINLESASRTMQRKITVEQVHTGILSGYERNWTLWDEVISTDLERQVKAVFLNLISAENSFLNGIMIEITDSELGYFLLREKNYFCTDVTKQVTFDDSIFKDEYRVLTFVGKKENLIMTQMESFFVFERYIDIVNKGIENFGKEFASIFNETTRPNNFARLTGIYTFVDNSQQKAR